jgi:hypothetical protein
MCHVNIEVRIKFSSSERLLPYFLEASGIYEFLLAKYFCLRDVLVCKQAKELYVKEIKAINLRYEQK